MSRQILAKVDAGSDYNGAASGTEMYFGSQLGLEWARASSVIYHEYTHNVVWHLYGQRFIGYGRPYTNWEELEASALDEGLADYFAQSLLNNPVHGIEGHFGIHQRNLDNNKQYSDWGSDPHDNGMIISGALWHLRQSIGNGTTDKLIIKALRRTPHPDTFHELYYYLLTEDDDNNNIRDGTPNKAAIDSSFNRHGILNDDKYDVKFWFDPGNETDTPVRSNPENLYFISIRDWIEHCTNYWGNHPTVNSISVQQNFNISIDNTTYTIDDPITFHLNTINNQDITRAINYNISLESKDPENESAHREVHQTLIGELTLAPSSSAVYDVSSTVPVLPFNRIIYAVAEVEGNKAVTTFEIRPSFELSADYNLIEGEAGKVNLTIKNNSSTSINDISIKLTTFSNVEVLIPMQSLGSIAPGETAILSWDVNVLSSGLSMLTFDISTSASSSGKISQLAQITSKPKLLVKADSIRINPGNPAEVTVDITNLGDIGLNNVIAELRLEDGLSTPNSLTQTIGVLEGRTTKQVSWTVTGSNFGNYLYSVYAKDGDVNASDIETITIIEEGHGVDLKVDGLDGKSKKYTFIKTPVNYAIDIINTGTREDTIDIYLCIPPWN